MRGGVALDTVGMCGVAASHSDAEDDSEEVEEDEESDPGEYEASGGVDISKLIGDFVFDLCNSPSAETTQAIIFLWSNSDEKETNLSAMKRSAKHRNKLQVSR